MPIKIDEEEEYLDRPHYFDSIVQYLAHSHEVTRPHTDYTPEEVLDCIWPWVNKDAATTIISHDELDAMLISLSSAFWAWANTQYACALPDHLDRLHETVMALARVRLNKSIGGAILEIPKKTVHETISLSGEASPRRSALSSFFRKGEP